MWNDSETKDEKEKGNVLKKRLKGVRKRKRSRRGSSRVDPFACDAVAFKMALVEAKRRRDDGS